MAKRPNLFDKEAFEQSLRDQGCAESFISPTVSDFKLFVPLLFRELGEERILEIVEATRVELGLRDQAAAWKTAIRYMVGWAEDSIQRYRAERANL